MTLARSQSSSSHADTTASLKTLQVRGRTEAEQDILQAAVDGCPLTFFQNLSHDEDGRAAGKNEPKKSLWWIYIHDTSHGCCVLHWAAGMGHLRLVQNFLTEYQGALDVNQQAHGKSQGRTALHYACRNGHLNIARYLVEQGANVNPTEAHHGVTPFHLAVWRNHLDICKWLIDDLDVDAGQSNVYGCTAIHWLGLIPLSCLRANEGSDILDLAKWLSQLSNVDVYAKQQQGHSALHKAAWGGHLVLCKYFHEVHGMYDDSPDEAGNYGADLADMGGHHTVAKYLREHCSSETLASCHVLGLRIDQRYDRHAIKVAYHTAARLLHPDRAVRLASGSSEEALSAKNRRVRDFATLTKAYRHFMDEGGVGSQCNPKHDLPLLLTSFDSILARGVEIETAAAAASSSAGGGTGKHTCIRNSERRGDRFASQLTAVVLEYGNKGLDLSNLRKKWRQLWPETDFPAPRKGSLKSWLERHASHVVSVQVDGKSGIHRVYAKYPETRANVDR
ncbi:hypothetical protein ACA910_020134 [Epithemia clementina (nom. ined.)]